MIPESPFASLPRPLRWLFLDLNSYFASVEQQLNPQLRGKPVIVSPIDSDTTCAIAASYEAKAYGVRTGTPVWEAKQMCRDLVIVHAQHGRYVDYHHKIIAEIWRHIPVTHICSIDEVACWLMDNENDEAAARALAQRIKAGIRRNVGEALGCSIGIAPSKLVAKLASNMQKPDGLTVIMAEELPERLNGLSLRDITGIGRNMERRLMRKGIYTVADFCALSPKQAAKCWGSLNGEQLWYQLHGYHFTEKSSVHRSIGHSNVLAPENRGLAAAHKVARRLTLKAASRARREGYLARRFVLHARRLELGGWADMVHLPTTDDNQQLLEALEQLWPRLAKACAPLPPNHCLKALGVTLVDIVPKYVPQLHLFQREDALLCTPSGRLGVALDRINARFGRNAITIGTTLAGRTDQVGTKIAFTRIPDMAEFHE